MAYSKQTWDTTSYVNPTRMNHIEDGIESASTATGTEYSSGVSVKDKIDSMPHKTQISVERNATQTMTLEIGVQGGILIISRGTNGIYALANNGVVALVSASGVTVSFTDSTHISITNSTNTIVATAIY